MFIIQWFRMNTLLYSIVRVSEDKTATRILSLLHTTR